MRPEITVILPCAGKGSRLGLPFPKELVPVNEDRLLIDSCLDLIDAAYENSRLRVVLLEDGKREQTADHIRAKLPHIPLALVRQGEKYRDMPEAVISLKPWFSVTNVVLLPDAVYRWEERDYDRGNDPVSDVAMKAASFGFAFAAVKSDPKQVGEMGALQVENDRVTRYADKPGESSDFNSFWVMLAFNSGTAGMAGLEQVRYGTFAKKEITGAPLVPAPVTWIRGYRDCGTWEGLEAEAIW